MTVETPGTLVGSGRNADVYDVGNGRVLRRYRDGRDVHHVEAEAQVMVHARALGVPVPEVFDVSGPDIVMERAAGPTMLDAIARRPWTVRAQAGLLARLHGLVHRVPASGLLGFVQRIPPPFGSMGPPQASDVLLHRDLHPQNVVLTGHGPVIIDWEGAARGPAIADIAMTWVIIGFSDIPGPRWRAVAARGVQASLTRAFIRAAGPIDEATRLTAVRQRLTDRNLLPSEVARLEKLAPAPWPDVAGTAHPH
jgi:aminoglycoside phosphotransferase (APT) family kinase protein